MQFSYTATSYSLHRNNQEKFALFLPQIRILSSSLCLLLCRNLEGISPHHFLEHSLITFLKKHESFCKKRVNNLPQPETSCLMYEEMRRDAVQRLSRDSSRDKLVPRVTAQIFSGKSIYAKKIDRKIGF